ncbi:MAG: fasciclin domain-containing protein [Nonlabens sp.]
MKNFNNILKFALCAILFTGFASCSDDDDALNQGPTAYDLLLTSPNYSSLRAAVDAAGLTATLADPNADLTVFAPDNTAFTSYLDGIALEDVPVAALRNILLNHVIQGEVLASQFTTGYVKTSASNSGGDALDIYVLADEDGVLINDYVAVDVADNMVSNGVVHLVDEVLAPSVITDFLDADENFSVLLTAINQENLFDTLEDENATFTVFAPNDAAFTALIDEDPNDDIDNAGDILGLSNLSDILTYHVVSGAAVRAGDIMNGMTVNPLFDNPNSSFTISTSGANPVITDGASRNTTIIANDVTAVNGVVHVIDNVLLSN